MFLFSNTISKETIVFYLTNQGRIQDLSEGGARFISEQNHPDLGTTFLG